MSSITLGAGTTTAPRASSTLRTRPAPTTKCRARAMTRRLRRGGSARRSGFRERRPSTRSPPICTASRFSSCLARRSTRKAPAARLARAAPAPTRTSATSCSVWSSRPCRGSPSSTTCARRSLHRSASALTSPSPRCARQPPTRSAMTSPTLGRHRLSPRQTHSFPPSWAVRGSSHSCSTPRAG